MPRLGLIVLFFVAYFVSALPWKEGGLFSLIFIAPSLPPIAWLPFGVVWMTLSTQVGTGRMHVAVAWLPVLACSATARLARLPTVRERWFD
jgi:ABC-type nitrate/sulfonate/bicarbonate transport system permease component